MMVKSSDVDSTEPDILCMMLYSNIYMFMVDEKHEMVG